MDEESYELGSRAAWLSMFALCQKRLGYSDPDIKAKSWVIEREEAIASLRILCDEYGDNDWDETLNLKDIIEKHLNL